MLALDLRSAYDLVQHADLIIALDELLRRNNAPRKHCFILLFAHNWLTHRKVSFEHTSFAPIVGLPQGSPISCSFFVIVMTFEATSDDPNVLISVYIFCDDITAIVASKTLASVETALTQLLADADSWCHATSMHLSVEKCRVLWFGLDRPPKTAYVSPVPVTAALTIKILGVTFDSHLTYAAHVDGIIAYIKKYMSPLRYLVKLGLSDALARQFALGIRCKITYGLYWYFKVAETRKQLLERWWCNVQRTALGARKALSRSYIYLASGFPKIQNFNQYLLTKRAFFWYTKKVPTRPIPTLKSTLEALPNATNSRTRRTTSQQSSQSRFEKHSRTTNPPTAALHKIVQENRQLIDEIVKTDKWPDTKVRRALGAQTVPMHDLWNKKTRLEIFKKYTPVFEPTVATSPQTTLPTTTF